MALESPLLGQAGFRHAFFTREGGVSAGPYRSLNLAVNTGDDPVAVAENRRRVAVALDVAEGRVFYASQVHGVDSAIADGSEPYESFGLRRADVTIARPPSGDARPFAIGVRSADCGTLLIGDRATGAVCAIHAGWKGTVLGVVEAGVAALRALLGAEGDLVAALGPHIERCCFEVGDDVAAELAACSSLGESVVQRAAAGARPHVDLRAILEQKLCTLGIDRAAIDHVRGCTVCDEARFFSYRRDGQKSGRLLAAIVADLR